MGIATGRWHGLSRDARVCQWCGNVDDEFHAVFECPALSEVRAKYVDLFAGFGGHDNLGGVSHDGRRMADFMQQDPRRVAAFVHECLQVLALCDIDDFPPTPVGTEVSGENDGEDLFFSLTESDQEFWFSDWDSEFDLADGEDADDADEDAEDDDDNDDNTADEVVGIDEDGDDDDVATAAAAIDDDAVGVG